MVLNVKRYRTPNEQRKENRKKFSFFVRFYRDAKYYLLRLVRKEDSPESIAHGMALGIFVGFLAIIPFQTVVVLIVNQIFKVNKFAGVIGINIFSSPITALPLFYLLHFVGKPFTGAEISYDVFIDLFKNFSIQNIASIGMNLFLSIILGGVIVGIIFYPITYIFTKRLILKYRNRRKKQII